jgi:hypothetical protein
MSPRGRLTEPSVAQGHDSASAGTRSLRSTTHVRERRGNPGLVNITDPMGDCWRRRVAVGRRTTDHGDSTGLPYLLSQATVLRPEDSQGSWRTPGAPGTPAGSLRCKLGRFVSRLG